MAAQRPNVIIFQEYEQVTVTPDIPDLHVLIVGGCYHILDYLDDKDDCYAQEYGALEGNCPAATPTAVILSDPPNNVAGGVLDDDSVAIFFDEARVILMESDNTPGTSDDSTYTLGDNLFSANDADGGADFGPGEIQPGDILLTTSPGTNDYVKTVKEVVYTLVDIGGALLFQTNGVQAGDLVTIANDVPPGGDARDGTYVVKRVRSDTVLEFVGLDWTQNAINSFGVPNVCDVTITDPNGAIRTGYPATGVQLANYSELRVTSDFAANSGANYNWRVEREVSDEELADTDFSTSGNEITVNSAITVDLSSTLTGLKVSYAKIYVQYKARRTDLQSVNLLSNFREMEEALGKYDARNPLFVGATVAKANTTTAVNVFGVTADTITAYLDFIDRLSSNEDVYAIVPLTYSTSIIAALNAMCENLADPNYVLTHGIRQKWRVVIGAVELQTQKYVVNALSGGTTSQQAATAPTDVRTMTLVTGGATPAIDLQTLGVVPGDKVTVVSAGPLTEVYTVAHVNAPLVLETDENVTNRALVAADSFTITNAAGTVVKYTHTLVGVDTLGVTGSALDNLYLIIQAAGAGFVTNGVIPGDILQIPEDPSVGDWTTVQSWTIDEVLSNERVRIVNDGTNTSELANELPHLSKRSDGAPIVAGTIYLRVMRNMTKAQQVDELVSIATSFSSKRTLLCYPDSVDVTDLVDGSLPRTDPETPTPANVQPGYYLSCAVGGQTAGNPPQQGFTNLGIAGIDRIYNSSDYFKEELLTELSNGGIYVFVQDNPSALPYTIHELTTDVTALEFSEYMVVKDFDFVAHTFLNTLIGFLGVWNVNKETIEFVRQALYTTGDVLKARVVAKIGAPLVDYTLESIGVSSLSADRIEAYMDVDLPMVLNTIGLHLVA